MRSLALPEQLNSKTKASFLVGLVTFAVLYTAFRYNTHDAHQEKRASNHAASDAVFLTSLHPITSAFAKSRQYSKHTAPSSTASRPSREENVITQQQRSLHIVYRLSRFHGTGSGKSRVVHIIVCTIGILGMFSAIVGALIGPWMAEIGADLGDDDRFAFWIREDEEDDDDERVCGLAREEKYELHRVLDVP